MRIPRILLLALMLMVCSSSIARAASWQAFVTDSSLGETTATPIDLGTNLAGSPVATAGTGGLGVAISPDARTAYIVDAGAVGASGQITPIDLTTLPPTPLAPINIPSSPGNFVAISPDGTKAYLTDPAGGKVFPIALPSGIVGSAIDVGGNPEGVAFSPDGAKAYVAENKNTGGSAEVIPIAVASDSPETPISTGLGPHPFSIAITPDGSTAYVGDAGSGTSGKVYPINLATDTVGSPLTVGGSVFGLAIAPDGHTVYATNGSSVTPIAISSGTLAAPIGLTGGASAVAVTPDSKTVLVTDDGAGTVTPIDVATATAETPIAVGGTPRGIAITPDQAPLASFSVTSAPPGSPAQFNASASTVAFGSIASYRWDFGDGSAPLTTATPTTSHTYAGPGSYQASVTEEDSLGTSVAGAVFTGQTASIVGSPAARAVRTVVVSSAAQPAFSISAAGLSFGAAGVGKTLTQTITIGNSGAAPLVISSSSLGGLGAPAFSLRSDGCTGATVAAGGQCVVTVAFDPLAAGGFSADLAFTDNASGSPHTITLSGSGTVSGSISGRVLDASHSPTVPAAGVTVLVCQPAFTGCFTVITDDNGEYHTGALAPGIYHVEIDPANGSPLVRYAVNVNVEAGPATVVSATLHTPKLFAPAIKVNTGGPPVSGAAPTVYKNSPLRLIVPTGALPEAEKGPPSPCFLSLETVTLSGRTAPGINGAPGYSFTSTQKIALSYPGPVALTFSTPENGELLNPAAVGQPATTVVQEAVGQGTITWTLEAESSRGGGAAYGVVSISLSGAQEVFGQAALTAFVHGNISTSLSGHNDWSCEVEQDEEEAEEDGEIEIDPSGYVSTAGAHAPVPRARVTLQRAGPKGTFTAPRTGEHGVYSPAVNPLFTDPLGHYGWNVVPGRYRVLVSHPGCRPVTSPVVTVPPPVTTLDVSIRCRGLTRTRTLASARVIGRAVARHGLQLAVRLRSRGHGAPEGYVAVAIAGHRYITPVSGAARTTVGVPIAAAGRYVASVSYSGDGYHGPAHARLVLSVARR